jgi:hypothetical protein
MLPLDAVKANGVQDISNLRIPENYAFPALLDGRGKDFK